MKTHTPSSAHPENAQQKAIESLDRLAYSMDSRFKIPGVDVALGWDSIVGLVPGIGDAASLLLSCYIVTQGIKLGAKKTTLARMFANAALDASLGSIPLFGDLFDVGFRANKKNVDLLRKDLSASTRAPRDAESARRFLIFGVIGSAFALIFLVFLIVVACVKAFQVLLS